MTLQVKKRSSSLQRTRKKPLEPKPMTESTVVKVFSEGITSDQKQNLIKALAASIRWKAQYKEDYEGDIRNITIISQCIEELAGNPAKGGED